MAGMEEFLGLLEKRRSAAPLLIGEPGPDAETLKRLLTIALRVPDHGKLEPWRLLVLEGEARAIAGQRLGDAHAAANINATDAEREKSRALVARSLSYAPVVVVVISRADPAARIPEWEQILSAGAVCMNLLTAAKAAGFDGMWLTGWSAYSPDAARIFGLEQGERIAGLVHIGTAREQQDDRKRPDMAHVVTHWRAD